MTDHITTMLDQLAEYQAERDAVALRKQALIDTILTPEIKAKLAEIDAEFSEQEEAATGKIAALEGEVKTAVVSAGTSVKGEFLQAVFNKGRVSWDTKSLDGYAKAHPEIAEFRKTGAPYVSIRKV